LRRAAFDVNVANAKVFYMPMKFGLKFVPVIGSDLFNVKRKCLNDMIDKVHGTIYKPYAREAGNRPTFRWFTNMVSICVVATSRE
jgi:hypothetical protein